MSELAKKYIHKEVESRIYKMWEEGGYFKASRDPNKQPYAIVLPPPNANGVLHVGHALMIALEDTLVRWKRMQGYSALWLPGTDHAGFETQVVYEKQLAKQGKSRFDFDRASFYDAVHNFVEDCKDSIHKQVRALGPSLDWSREKYTLESDVLDTVYKTFEKLSKEDLVYRDNYMVNYCPKCGTTFADLEILHEERKTSLYYIKYPFVDSNDYVVVATTRPEPIFIDTHLAVNPEDKTKSHLIGKKVLNPLTNVEMEIIGDTFVVPEFGTGIVKLTPGHDKNDYDVAKKHNLPVISMLGLDGRVSDTVSNYPALAHIKGMSVNNAREEVVKILQEKGLVEKIDTSYVHSVAVCYKGNHVIEPMVLPNWFVRVDTLKKPALDAVLNGDVTIYPKWREITYTQWMEEMHDWPISRQLVWGIRIPVWYSVEENPELMVTFLDKHGNRVHGLLKDLLDTYGGDYTFVEIEKGLQSLMAPKEASYVISASQPFGYYLQETDVFDTWFSSGHWPLVTLGYPNSEDFNYFYPTAVLETGWEIIRFWVSRMIMFGIYLTGKAPFKDVYLHGLVRAADGKKMSKSLGNQVDPLDAVETYGADALRMGLISGTATGQDFSFPQDKVIAYRNFANKIWNMVRFIDILENDAFMQSGGVPKDLASIKNALGDKEKQLILDFNALITAVTTSLEKYRFADAGDALYHFMWDTLASDYIEYTKTSERKDVSLCVLRVVLKNSLKLLHPFMPFVTEELWSHVRDADEDALIVTKWPDQLSV